MRNKPVQWEIGIFFAALAVIIAWSDGGRDRGSAAAWENTFSPADSSLPVKEIGPAAPWLRISLDDSTRQRRLTPAIDRVTRLGEDVTDGAGDHNDNDAEGVFRCVCCGQPLFHSNAKSTSGTGWLSFERCIGDDGTPSAQNSRLGSMWSEVVCGRCGSHVGYLFPDETSPTEVRYRISGDALVFDPGATDTSKTSLCGTGGGGTPIPSENWGVGHSYSRRYGFSHLYGNAIEEDVTRIGR
ncbi:MAG: peptide-methionine (R)-S-oxide reductase [Candidatus Eisenbacteria bacterium]|nr:peptide-methionine (R)-S-oxide reductase [Candidatus Eisenbacteria bacterium]